MGSLLKIEPQVLSFPYELNKQVSCTIRLSNVTRKNVAFKVMATKPANYGVRPHLGIVLPGSSLDIIGYILLSHHQICKLDSLSTMRLRKRDNYRNTLDVWSECRNNSYVRIHSPEVLRPEQKCKDKFKIRSAFASPDATTEDQIQKLLDENSVGVQECKLGVIYAFPSQVPSPVAEESMNVKKLLDVTPPELQFPLELKKELSCLLQLENMTQNHVFFKVKTTHPKKYSVQPKIGIVLPRSTCDVVVRMLAQTKIPLDGQCKDKFLIQSMVGSPAATTEELTPEMFDDPRSVVEGFELSVVYTFPSHPQSSTYERSEARSSLDASTLPNINTNDPEVTRRLDRNESNVGPLFMKGITIGLLGLIFWYIMMKMLPLIWSLTFVITMLVVKMIKSIVSDSFEDWIVKSLVYICIHFFSVIFGRRPNISIT